MIISVNFLGDGLRDAFDTTSADALIDWQEKPPRWWRRVLRRIVRRAATGAAQRLAVTWNRTGALRPLRAHDLGWALAGGERPLVECLAAERPAPRIPIPAPLSRAIAPLGVVAMSVSRLLLGIERLPVALRLLRRLIAILCSWWSFSTAIHRLRYPVHFNASEGSSPCRARTTTALTCYHIAAGPAQR